MPDRIRTSPNWIGHRGCSLAETSYAPPTPLSVESYLQNQLEHLQSSTEQALLQAAILHAPVELIHPFNDINGRIGRLLIPLILTQKQTLCRPIFYLSEHFERHREDYIGLLNQRYSTRTQVTEDPRHR